VRPAGDTPVAGRPAGGRDWQPRRRWPSWPPGRWPARRRRSCQA